MGRLLRFLPAAAIAVGLGYPIYLVLHAHAASGGADSFPLDDAWIHLTYARNLAQHGRFAYFPSDPTTAGSTSPLYTMLLSLGFLVTSHEKALSYVLGLICHGAFLVALALWAQTRLRSAAWTALAVLLVALDGRVGILAVAGMETSLFLLLVALAFLARIRRRPQFLGVAVGLAVWARPEGLILAGVLALDGLLARAAGRAAPGSDPEPPLDWRRAAIPAGLLVLGWCAFNRLLGESFLPNTVAAKTTYYQPNPRGAFLRQVVAAFTGGGWIVLFPLAVGGIVREGVRLARRRAGFLRAEAGWVLGLPLAFVLYLPFAHRFDRYLVPALPALGLLGIAAARDLARRLAAGGEGLTPGRLIAVTASVIALGLQAIFAAEGDRDYRTLCRYHLVRHERAGRWLAEHTPPGAVIATHDVGAIAFYSGRRIVDTVGVVLPEAVQHLHSEGYFDYLRRLFARMGVTHLAVLRDWLEVVNVEPLFTADPEPEILEVFAWEPGRTHLLHPQAAQLNQRAILAVSRGQPSVAAQLLAASLQTDRESSRTWLLLARTIWAMGRLEEAERACREALARFPGWPEAQQVLAGIEAAKRR